MDFKLDDTFVQLRAPMGQKGEERSLLKFSIKNQEVQLQMRKASMQCDVKVASLSLEDGATPGAVYPFLISPTAEDANGCRVERKAAAAPLDSKMKVDADRRVRGRLPICVC